MAKSYLGWVDTVVTKQTERISPWIVSSQDNILKRIKKSTSFSSLYFIFTEIYEDSDYKPFVELLGKGLRATDST